MNLPNMNNEFSNLFKDALYYPHWLNVKVHQLAILAISVYKM